MATAVEAPSREKVLWANECTRRSAENPSVRNHRIFRLTDHELPPGVTLIEFNKTGEYLLRGDKTLQAIDNQVAYIDASITSLDGLTRFSALTSLLRQFNYPEVVGFFRHLTSTRGDRPADDQLPFKESIPVESAGRILSGSVDRVFIVEPHSGVVTTFLSELGVPTVGISPSKSVIDQFSANYKGDRNRMVLLSPDHGRETQAERIATYLGGVKLVSLNKQRQNGKVTIGELTEDQREVLRGSDVVAYDDTIATGGTFRKIVDVLAGAEVNGVYLLSCHGVFCGQAIQNLSHPLIRNVYVTDSREFEGDKKILGNRLIEVPTQPFVDHIIGNDIWPNFNPYCDLPSFFVTKPASELPPELSRSIARVRRQITSLENSRR